MHALAWFTTLARHGLRILPTLLVFSLSSVEAEPTPGLPVVSPVPGVSPRFKMVEAKLSADGTEATLVLQSDLGIFSFNLAIPADARLTKLTLLIEKQKFCEGLDFCSTGGQTLELRTAEGVKIAPRGADLAIEITGKTLQEVRPGGKIQYVNQYR